MPKVRALAAGAAQAGRGPGAGRAGAGRRQTLGVNKNVFTQKTIGSAATPGAKPHLKGAWHEKAPFFLP